MNPPSRIDPRVRRKRRRSSPHCQTRFPCGGRGLACKNRRRPLSDSWGLGTGHAIRYGRRRGTRKSWRSAGSRYPDRGREVPPRGRRRKRRCSSRWVSANRRWPDCDRQIGPRLQNAGLFRGRHGVKMGHDSETSWEDRWRASCVGAGVPCKNTRRPSVTLEESARGMPSAMAADGWPKPAGLRPWTWRCPLAGPWRGSAPRFRFGCGFGFSFGFGCGGGAKVFAVGFWQKDLAGS